LAAAPAQFDDEVLEVRRPGPDQGQHSREVLEEVGYSPDEIDALVVSHVVVASP
jgi:crotonobetainyl-CoA:carnitine CoA-transferase CaiB-like acyl-CoA transferase